MDYFTYSFEKALPALALLAQKAIPLIICSSKTKAEIEYYRKKLGNTHPFVSENGGGIFIPKNYFDLDKTSHSYAIEEEGGYDIIRLGSRYSDLRNAIKELQREGFQVRGFGDMRTEELMMAAGMSFDEAVMARERNFDEPFLFEGDNKDIYRLLSSITSRGFNYTKGRFFHILGESDKGKAVSILTDFYRGNWGDILTIALGDRSNDLPMLKEVNCPILVQRPDGTYEPRIEAPNLVRANGIGPEGWNSAVLDLLNTLFKN